MTNYRKVPFGYINAEINKTQFNEICNDLQTSLTLANDDYNFKIMPTFTKKVYYLFKTITGNNFKDFLIANYEEGLGLRSNLVTSIVNYLNGTYTTAQLEGAIKRDLNSVKYYTEFGAVSKSIITNSKRYEKVDNLKNLNISNDCLLKVLAGIGPINMSNLILSFNME